MFRALVGKALKQQRAIVAAGIGTGLLFALLLSLAIGGLYGTRPVGAADAIGSALPLVLVFGIWPLWALLAFSQAFTAERAAGTEPFLLDRPVPPRRLFVARLIAALAGWSAVAATTLAIAWLLARVVYEVPTDEWPLLFQAGLGLSAIAACSTLLAAALGAVSLAAALLGLLLGLAVLAVAFQLLRALPVLFEAIGWFSLWPVVLLVLAYPLAAWFAFTRGEPAGRGRARRAVLALGISALLIAALFWTVTPALIRLGLGGPEGRWDVELAPGDKGAVFNSWRQLWVVDPATGAPRRFFPPWSAFIGWRPDGAMFAVATRSTRLGGESRHERIAFFDAEGNRAAPEIELELDEIQIFGFGVQGGLWVGDELYFVTAQDSDEGALWSVKPGDGRERLAAAHLPELTRPLRATADGMIHLVSYRRRGRQELKGAQSVLEDQAELLRFDPRTGKLDRRGSISRGRVLYAGLASSGRYWLVDTGNEAGARLAVLDLTTGERVDHPIEGAEVLDWAWLGGDRLALAVMRGERAHLVLTGPGGGGAREDLGSWPARPAWGWLKASPDGSKLLVRDHATRRARVLHVADGRWTEIDVPPGAAAAARNETTPVNWSWAGERTLVIPGTEGPLLVDIDAPSRVRAIAW